MSTYTEDRQALHAYLSQRSHDILQTFGEENGVSATGLIEALCVELGEEIDAAGSTDIREGWIKSARKIDAKRRRRG